MDIQAGFNCLVDSLEEAKKLLMAVAWLTLSNHGPFQDIQSGEQGGGSVPLIVVRLPLRRPGRSGNTGWVRSSAWI